jgi:D-serine deaminase-like pyridoxal phosphate-dependent protein
VKLEEINTPALVTDLDAMDFNLHRMAGFFATTSAKLRPHFKNHKCPMLARKQLRAGAIGMTCATVREAEILVHHGVDSILIANEIAGEAKPRLIAELSRYASILVAVDSRSGVTDLARAQRAVGTQIEVLVDINIGLDRCGVQPGAEAAELAQYAAAQGLGVRGVMGYDGHLQVLPPSEERDQRIREGSQALVTTADLIKTMGIPVTIISTGGTGSYGISGLYPGITELQSGSYLLMDDLYVERGSSFQRSLTLLTTVISKRGSHSAVIDCGMKEISSERGLPQTKGIAGTRIKALHAEHGLVEIDPNLAPPLEVGQKLELWVRYSDATMNLHNTLYGVRHGAVEEIFQIEH